MTHDALTIRPGSHLSLAGAPARVEETLELTVDDFTWHSHRLTGHPDADWLTVEDDEGTLSLTLWKDRPGLPERGEPGDRNVVCDGTKLRRNEDGTGTYRSLPSGRSGRYAYADYRLGGTLVAFERFDDGAWEPSTGRHIPAFGVQVTGGSS